MPDSPDEEAPANAKSVLRNVIEFVVAVAMGLLAFAALQTFFPPQPKAPEGAVQCTFQLSANATPARRTATSMPVSQVEIDAKLTGRFEDNGSVLWQMNGSAALGNQTIPISGVLFINHGIIDGLMLDQGPLARESDQLMIATLNRDGVLDTNESIAYVRFATEPKLGHPFRYRCKATVPK